MTSVEEVKKMLPLEARCIQSIQEFKAPRTTQDAVDQMAAEYATANYLRQQAEKRYDAAKFNIASQYADEVAQLREDATSSLMKSTTTVAGEDWSLTFNANKPATRVDAQELRTELIKNGISVEVIDRAIKRVTKLATPALSIVAARMVE
jgi:hypothetical protein